MVPSTCSGGCCLAVSLVASSYVSQLHVAAVESVGVESSVVLRSRGVDLKKGTDISDTVVVPRVGSYDVRTCVEFLFL